MNQAFLREQLKNVDAEIQRLTINRGKADDLAIGNITIKLDALKRERQTLLKELEAGPNAVIKPQQVIPSNTENTPETVHTSRDTIKFLVEQDDLDTALDKLSQLSPKDTNLILIIARQNRNEKDYMIGDVSRPDYQLERRRIANAILKFLNMLS